MKYEDLDSLVTAARRDISNRDYIAAQRDIALLKGDLLQATSRMQSLSLPHTMERGEVPLLTLKSLLSRSKYSLTALTELRDWALPELRDDALAEDEPANLSEAVEQFGHTLEYFALQITRSDSFLTECLSRGLSILES